MKIEYLHASKYGNGVIVAAEFKQQMAARGVVVDVHHMREVSPTDLAPADLYLFSSPGRFGKPIGRRRRCLERVRLPAGTSTGRAVTLLASTSPSAACRRDRRWSSSGRPDVRVQARRDARAQPELAVTRALEPRGPASLPRPRTPER